MEARPFFYAGDGVISPDLVVLDCYRLAKFYSVDPCIFLAKPMSELQRHVIWTGKLAEKLAEEQEAAMPNE